jgi:hypothetical protein
MNWSFIAMQYYGLILNRTYVLTVNGARLNGKVCRGITAIEGGDALTRYITSQLAVHGDLNSPASYIDPNKLSKPHRADFSIALSDISSVEYTAKKKWGMGHYPHDGRVFVYTAKKKYDFIILGTQPGKDIASRLSADIGHAKGHEG